ncbi:MAG: N-succinylarginine dihydrolase [Thermodesulfobacteriota bacterium]
MMTASKETPSSAEGSQVPDRGIATEINFDGLVGPTHNYAGLAYGNVAAATHALTVSNPRSAVLEGLNKMKLLLDLGITQGIIPPQERPNTRVLRELGFRGSDVRIIEQAAREAPHILAACYSASAMWTANAATVSPSADTEDGKVHFTPANLVSFFHRAIESQATARILKAIFRDESVFVHHDPLPRAAQFSDEGAANHTRFCQRYGEPGVELFVYGKKAFGEWDREPKVFPARQTLEASAAIARLHGLTRSQVILAQQNPDVIDAGVFHNDVISVGNQQVLLYHSLAFADPRAVIDEIRRCFSASYGTEPILIEVTADRITVVDAVSSYLFNSQLVTLPDGTMCLIAPQECAENVSTSSFLEDLVAGDGPITQVKIVDIRQSMKNGGGPACLRLRVVLNERERNKVHKGAYLTDRVYTTLRNWAERNYREEIHPSDLVDPLLIEESRRALDELTAILGIGSIYDFQTDASCG